MNPLVKKCLCCGAPTRPRIKFLTKAFFHRPKVFPGEKLIVRKGGLYLIVDERKVQVSWHWVGEQFDLFDAQLSDDGDAWNVQIGHALGFTEHAP